METTLKFASFLKGAFFNCDKYSIITAGRQTGKTHNAVIWITTQLLNKSNQKGLWVDVTQNNLDKYVDRYFRAILKDIWKYCRYEKQSKILTLPNGSIIDFRSAERPENMEGFNYNFVVVNEAGLVLKKSNLWYNTILPMTKSAVVKFIGTPKGKNTFHQLYHQKSSGWNSYKFTAYQSPYWEKNALDKIKTEIPQIVFSQEFMAEFQENESTVFRSFAQCVQDYETNLPPIDGFKYYAGVDLAKFNDFTVITILDQNGKLAYWDRFNQIDYTFQKTRILEVVNRYNASVIIDSTGVGVAIFDDLKKVLGNRLQGYTFNNTSKKELIENLVLGFETNKITINKNETLMAELEIFEYSITKSGNISYSAPDGFHDDAVISLGLAYGLISTKKELFFDWV